MRITILLLLVFIANISFGLNQNKRKPQPVFQEISNKDVIQSVFPEAINVEKENKYWFKILDNEKKTLGFAMSSIPYCNDVIGYNGKTPVLIVTDKELIIKKISLLSHWENAPYVLRLDKKGFFGIWNNNSIKNAIKIVPDGYTGATVTALAVAENVQFLLKNGSKALPKKKK